jgi:hypothetical protein
MAAVRCYYLRESWHRHRVWLEDLQKQGRIPADQPLTQVGMLATAQPDSRMVTVSQKAMLRKAPRLTVGANGGGAAAAMDAAGKASLLRMGPGAMPSPASHTQRVLRHEPDAGKAAARPDSSQSNRSAKSAKSAHRVLPPIQNGGANATAFLPELTGAVVRDEAESDATRLLRDQLAQRDKEVRNLKQQNALLQDINRSVKGCWDGGPHAGPAYIHLHMLFFLPLVGRRRRCSPLMVLTSV